MSDDNYTLITGAAGGLGKATARLLSALGANLILTDLEAPDALAEELGQDAKMISRAVDVSDSSSVMDLVNFVSSSGLVVDGVVHFAGITRDRTLLNMSDEEWQQVIDVNLTGTFNVVKAFGEIMKPTGGSIVTVGSVVAKFGNYGQANYVAAKAGVESFTKVVAREFARYGIRVNCIVPGFIESPMSLKIPQERMNQIIAMIPMGRIGKPEEIADLVEFLLSDKSSYITGTPIQIDGGLRM